MVATTTHCEANDVKEWSGWALFPMAAIEVSAQTQSSDNIERKTR